MRVRLFAAAILLVGLISSSHVVAQSIVVESIPAEPITDWTNSAFWECVDGKPVENSWEFNDGNIQLVQPRGGAGSLLSPPLSANFDLSFEWKVDLKANNGLKYRVRQYGKKWLGLEYQMIDEPAGATGKTSTASIYDLVAPIPSKPLHPTTQWNSSRIVAVGANIKHYLNGQLVAQLETVGPTWDSRFATSKYWGNSGFAGADEEARIMLTDHGGKATFRNFRFVKKERSETAAPVGAAPFLANGIRNSWADQTSIALWTRTTANAGMITDGPNFLPISAKEASRLSELTDADKLLAAQLPDGGKLDEMFGACPGTAGEVRLTYFPVLQRKAMETTQWITTKAENDFTVQWHLKDLKPNRRYAAVVEARAIGSKELTSVSRGEFTTSPKPTEPQKLKFCLTTCHDFIRRDDDLRGHKIYPAMSAIEPDFVVHAGDIEYYDKPKPWAMTEELMRFKWARLFALPNNRDFYQRTTSYFLKDDHDTLKNDCWHGQMYGSVSFERGQEIFNHEQFPSHPLRYKTVRWGRDLQFWLLEGRDYRSANRMLDGPEKSILGETQKAWLLKTLAESDAEFKLVFSPTPIVGPDRENKKDNHSNKVFAYEGQQLRSEFAKHGVIVLCGDRHWQYASEDAEAKIWEFGCGPGSDSHAGGWKANDERDNHRFLRVGGGFLSGELSINRKDQPTLKLQHHTVTGESVSEFKFPRKE